MGHQSLSLPRGTAVRLQLLESNPLLRIFHGSFSRPCRLRFESTACRILAQHKIVVGAGWADREGTLSPHLTSCLFMFEQFIINITSSPTTSPLITTLLATASCYLHFPLQISNHICRANPRLTMEIKPPDNYISLFGPEQIETGANLTADGWRYANRGSRAAQADWDLFDNASTPRVIKSINEDGYHMATILAPELPPKKLVALAYIIEWKHIFSGKNSQHK
jgi:hypothetical protein